MVQDTIPSRLWSALDGYDIDRGFGRGCPSCEQGYEVGDRLFAIAERPPRTEAWTVSSVVCADCGRQSLSKKERQAALDQALVSAELAAASMTLVLDSETARLLNRSPPREA